MLKSKSLTNLIYEINNKPIYYNIKLQKTDEKTFFSSKLATTPTSTNIPENIVDKKINQSNHIANFYIKIQVLQKTSENKQYVYIMKNY